MYVFLRILLNNSNLVQVLGEWYYDASLGGAADAFFVSPLLQHPVLTNIT